MATRASAGSPTRTPVQLLALVFGVVFLLVGVLGFVPGITSGAAGLTFAGPGSMAMLLGIFHVSILHNIVHLLFGVAGIALARTPGSARSYLIGSGVIYALLVIYGFLVPADGAANFVPVNTADNWLHVVLAIALLAGGLALGRRAARR
jgi:hypothetical protein